jgi:hypothetical protein
MSGRALKKLKKRIKDKKREDRNRRTNNETEDIGSVVEVEERR